MIRAETVMNYRKHRIEKVSGLGAWMLVIIFLIPAATSAALINSYDFDGDLTDTLGNGVDLVALGGTISSGRYVFDNNQGLSLASALPSTTSYQIEIKFQMTTNPTTFNKLVDFESLAIDIGLYINGDRLRFFTDSSNGVVDRIPLNTDVTVNLIRDGSTNEVKGLLNGVEQWSFIDTVNHAVPSGNILNFFVDDNATSQREAFAGSVEYIRISNIPEPGTAVLLMGLAGLGMATRRRTA